jgi:Fic family protein
MLLTNRQPRTKDEQMIINSYQVMQRLDTWKSLSLSKEMLLEIQTIVTEKTMDDPLDQGRFRTDTDEIVVHDPFSGEIVHTPPTETKMLEELDDFIEFANEIEEEGDFIHPVVKASLLHFWLAYLHPFVDGNGRTARTIFYWYLLKKEYWLVQYLSISRSIVESRKRYDEAFIRSEIDDNDLTYFILYISESFKNSIIKFIEYFERKTKEQKALGKKSGKLARYNIRQIELMNYLLNNPNETITIQTHKLKHGISRQTAHTDLIELSELGILTQTFQKRKFVFLPNISTITKLFKP